MKKIVEFLIGENDDTGVKAISLVDNPAMESDFIAFNKDKKPKYISLGTDNKDYKQIVAGLSIIPDKLIYRSDEETGEEYWGYFSQETIEQIRNKYHKEMQTSNVNLNHNDNIYIEAYLVESYLLNTQERVDEVTAQGIEGATLGAWYTQFKIENEDVFQQVLDGDFNGLSIEAYLNKELTASLKNKFKEKEKKMKTNLIDKFKAFLETLENEEAQVTDTNLEEALESALVPELDITINWGEVEAEVTKTYTNEEDEEVTEPIGQGEFVLEDGRIVVVDEDSKLIEVKDAVEEEESTETTEEAEVKAEKNTEITKKVVKTEVKAEIKTEVKAEETEESTETTEEEGLPEAVKAWLTKIAGDFEDGDIYVSFTKSAGELIYGSVSTWANIKMSKDIDAKKVALEAKVADLETKLAEPIAEPKLSDSTIDSGEVKELTVYQKIMKRKNLQEV